MNTPVMAVVVCVGWVLWLVLAAVFVASGTAGTVGLAYYAARQLWRWLVPQWTAICRHANARWMLLVEPLDQAVWQERQRQRAWEARSAERRARRLERQVPAEVRGVEWPAARRSAARPS